MGNSNSTEYFYTQKGIGKSPGMKENGNSFPMIRSYLGPILAEFTRVEPLLIEEH